MTTPAVSVSFTNLTGDQAQRILVAWRAECEAAALAPASALDSAQLDGVLDAVFSANASPEKTRYAFEVAKAGSEGAAKSSLRQDVFDGNSGKHGATHRAIEALWQKHGGKAWNGRLIYDSPDGAYQIMLPLAREYVLNLLGPMWA
jgi:hypothetical protein